MKENLFMVIKERAILWLTKNINHLIEKMVFTEGLSDSEKVKSRLKNIFPNKC